MLHFTSLRVGANLYDYEVFAAVGAAVAINAVYPIQDVDYDWLVAILKEKGR